jgi:hypothetical protein
MEAEKPSNGKSNSKKRMRTQSPKSIEQILEEIELGETILQEERQKQPLDDNEPG